jgi:tetratricopeptide (TPR) repeat protein
MRKAVQLEAATDKHPVTPGPLIPARELLAEMLLELGRPAEALAEFERVKQAEPNRLMAIYGAAQAAELAGRPDVARENYQALLTLTAPADSERKEIAQAKAFVARN